VRTAQDLDLESLEADVHAALAAWGESAGADETLLSSLLLVQGVQEEQGDNRGGIALRQATNSVLEAAIHELRESDETGAAVLKARFVDGEITRRVAYRLHASPDQVNRWQKRAIRSLAPNESAAPGGSVAAAHLYAPLWLQARPETSH
jgi:hypothetical protein